MTFGRRVEIPLGGRASVTASRKSGSTELIFMLVAQIALAVVSSLYIYIVVMKVPIERPFEGIFSDGKFIITWAPVWMPPLISAILAATILALSAISRVVLSFRGVALMSLIVVYMCAVVTGFVVNIGYAVLTQRAGLGDIAPFFFSMFVWQLLQALLKLLFFPELLLLPAFYAIGWRSYQKRWR